MVTDVTATEPAGVVDRLVLARRSIRHFRDEAVAPELLEAMLRQSIWAPSPHNSQPWRFTVLLKLEDRQSLGDAMARQLALELEADGLDEEEIGRQTDRSRRRIGSAPVVIVCSLVSQGLVRFEDRRRAELEWQMAVQSVGAVFQTLFLLAADRGIGSCWMAAPMYCPEVVREVLDLPSHYQPQALALLGYPAAEGRVRDRLPFGEVVEFR